MADSTDQAWQRIETSELAQPGVSAGTGFGRNAGLRVSAKIFAIRMEEELVVKLPKERVQELVDSGVGRPWGPGQRVMKEWVSLSPRAAAQWQVLVEESRKFVGSELRAE